MELALVQERSAVFALFGRHSGYAHMSSDVRFACLCTLCYFTQTSSSLSA
jgi:hypothetical protein